MNLIGEQYLPRITVAQPYHDFLLKIRSGFAFSNGLGSGSYSNGQPEKASHPEFSQNFTRERVLYHGSKRTS
jgi:hypothetical protein